LLKNIDENALREFIACPVTFEFMLCMVDVCVSNKTETVSAGNTTYQRVQESVTPIKSDINAIKALLCSFNSIFSLKSCKSFSSSSLIIPYNNGIEAMTVKKTMIRLDCNLNIHKLKKIATDENTNPKSISLAG